MEPTSSWSRLAWVALLALTLTACGSTGRQVVGDPTSTARGVGASAPPVVAVAAPSSASASTTMPSAARPAGAGGGLLRLEDLPAGFRSVTATDDADAGSCQGAGFLGSGRPSRSAAFQRGDGLPFTIVRTWVVAEGAPLMASARRQLGRCGSFEETSRRDGTTTRGTLQARDPGALGDEALAYDFSASTAGIDTTGTIVIVRVRSAVGLLVVAASGSGGADVVPGLASRMVSRLERSA